MKIVIDIPDEVYNFTKNRGHLPYGVNLAGRIIDGTLLPKGHGDLISRSAVRKKCIQAQDWGDTNTYINRGLAIAVDFIDCAPAVISADKENK